MGWRALGTSVGNVRSSNGKNRMIFCCGIDVVDGGGGGNATLVDLVGRER